MFRTIVRQNRGVCSAWNFQDSFQNGGGLLRCSEGAGCSAVVGTVIHAVDLMETVDGSGSGGVFIHENQVNCGSIVARGDLHPSPPGAVLQQAREPKLAAGRRDSRDPWDTFPKIWDAASRSPLLRDRANGAILFSYLSEDVIERVPFGQEREGFSYERGVSGLPQLRPGCGDGGAPLQRMRLQYPGWLSA